MSKKRKTRQGKIIAELRRKVELSKVQSTEFTRDLAKAPRTLGGEHVIFQPTQSLKTLKLPNLPNRPIARDVIITKNYSYVVLDMKKTFLITFVLLILNIVIFFLIQKNIIS